MCMGLKVMSVGVFMQQGCVFKVARLLQLMKGRKQPTFGQDCWWLLLTAWLARAFFSAIPCINLRPLLTAPAGHS